MVKGVEGSDMEGSFPQTGRTGFMSPLQPPVARPSPTFREPSRMFLLFMLIFVIRGKCNDDGVSGMSGERLDFVPSPALRNFHNSSSSCSRTKQQSRWLRRFRRRLRVEALLCPRQTMERIGSDIIKLELFNWLSVAIDDCQCNAGKMGAGGRKC